MSFTVEDLIGLRVLGHHNLGIGKVTHVYSDKSTGLSTWVAVKVGMFNGNSALIPLASAVMQGPDLFVPYSKQLINEAPQHAVGTELTSAEEALLLAHYNVPLPPVTDPPPHPLPVPNVVERPSDPFEPPLDILSPVDLEPGKDAMTRSEEELHVGVETVETGKVTLKKNVVVEQETVIVPVAHEEIVVEREALPDVVAPIGTELHTEEHEMIAHAEKPVITKTTVAKEKVKLRKDVVTDSETIVSDVRKEEIHVEKDEKHHGHGHGHDKNPRRP